MGALLHCYTCAGGGQILENWGKAEPKWRFGVMVEAMNHQWLHPTSILDVCKIVEHLHMLWMGIWVHPYTVIPVQVGTKFWKIGVRRSSNDVAVSWLRLYIPHQYWMYIKCLSTFICCGWAYGCTLSLLYLCTWGPNFGKLWLGQAPMTLWCHGWGCKPLLTASHINIGCV